MVKHVVSDVLSGGSIVAILVSHDPMNINTIGLGKLMLFGEMNLFIIKPDPYPLIH